MPINVTLRKRSKNEKPWGRRGGNDRHGLFLGHCTCCSLQLECAQPRDLPSSSRFHTNYCSNITLPKMPFLTTVSKITSIYRYSQTLALYLPADILIESCLLVVHMDFNSLCIPQISNIGRHTVVGTLETLADSFPFPKSFETKFHTSFLSSKGNLLICRK